jgi:hypothetical protein
VEYLARTGRHQDALNLALDSPAWGVPWFRSGIGYLEKRAKIYASVSARQSSDLQISESDAGKIRKIANTFGELADAVDMNQTSTVLRGLPKLKLSA